MKLTDYLQTYRCKKCGAWYYIPVSWGSKKFPRPEYSTCRHGKHAQELAAETGK